MDLTAQKRRPALAKDYLDVTRLVRCIQRAEGNLDCFRRIADGCRETNCCWRPYCCDETGATHSADSLRSDLRAWRLNENEPGLKNSLDPSGGKGGDHRHEEDFHHCKRSGPA